MVKPLDIILDELESYWTVLWTKVKLFSTMKKNETIPFSATWMDQEIVILSEVSQRQITYDITYMWNLKEWYR